MAKVAVVTDSTAYVPQNLVDQHHIQVAPQVLIWGDETYQDGVDIQPDEFYRRLRTAKVMPSTSQVTPASFYHIFKNLIDEGYQVLAILISRDLSGTIASAQQAKDMLEDAPVEIVDSRTTAMAMGFHVLTAARAAEQGATLAECKQLAEEARDHTGVVFAVDTLEFLYRGGRIGTGTRFMGAALSIKPIFEIREGRIEALERVRTRKKSLRRLQEIIEERIAGQTPVRLATLHANAYQDACDLLTSANGNFSRVEESILSTVSPVVGTHAGPGTVGLAYMAGM